MALGLCFNYYNRCSVVTAAIFLRGKEMLTTHFLRAADVRCVPLCIVAESC
jgi:hypothetical protein